MKRRRKSVSGLFRKKTISITLGILDHINSKKDFNLSEWFCDKYSAEFMRITHLKNKIKFHSDALKKAEIALIEVKANKQICRPSYDPKRCTVCNMLYRENISFRRKTRVFKDFFACSLCINTRQDDIEKVVHELKLAEQETKNEKFN